MRSAPCGMSINTNQFFKKVSQIWPKTALAKEKRAVARLQLPVFKRKIKRKTLNSLRIGYQ